LVELEDEIHNISESSSSRRRSYYDIPPNNTMNKKSTSSPRLEHPVPKPRRKVPPKAASIDVVEGDKERHLHPNRSAIMSQYSCLNAEQTDPSTLVITRRPDQYINPDRYYENIPYEPNWHYNTGRHDSPGELVIQPGMRAEAYARTLYTPRGVPENSGAAVMPFNQFHEQNQPPRNNTLPPIHFPSHPSSSEIRYPPPLVDRMSYVPPAAQEESTYDSLRYVSHDKLKTQEASSHAAQDDSHSNSTPSASSPRVRRPSGKYAHLIDEVQEKLPQASEELCIQYLTKNKGNVEQVIRDLKVHILMDMGLDNASMDNCRKALGHCQWKLDRAAEWLIEQSLS